jgi:hypothetical protein
MAIGIVPTTTLVQAPLDHKVRKVFKVRLVPWVRTVLKVLSVLQDCKAFKVRKAFLD